VSRHVPPHRWADALAGRLGARQQAQMTRHATTCPRCAQARDRVTAASGAFPALRGQRSPELSWDSIRVGVHWSVSSERNARVRAATASPSGRWWPLAALGLAAAVAGGVVVASHLRSSEPTVPAVATSPTAPVEGPGSVGPVTPGLPRTAPPTASPTALVALISRASGEVRIGGELLADRELFARSLTAGATVATGDGRVDIQFGEASALAVGAHSTVALRRFDARAVELAVDGTIDVVVSARAPEQRFAVVAGAHTIEVRGTQFRVSRDGDATTVSCRHGLVAVRDARGVVEVGAAQRVVVHAGHPVVDEHVTLLASDELAQLAAATPLTSPIWLADAPAQLAATSSPLAVVTPAGAGRRAVRVDGIELGDAPLRVRVLPGRHLVEASDAAGRYRRVGWADIAARPAAATPTLRVELPVDAPSTASSEARRRELRAGIDRARLARCVRSIAKAGLSGTYVQVELAVDVAGSVGFLNVVDTDLPASTAACVREVLADVRFARGAAATWRERLDL
jgi:hypothetical protein